MSKCGFNKVGMGVLLRTVFSETTSGWLLLNKYIIGDSFDFSFMRSLDKDSLFTTATLLLKKELNITSMNFFETSVHGLKKSEF